MAAGIRIRFTLTCVLWSQEPYGCEEADEKLYIPTMLRGFGLRKHDSELKLKIVRALRSMPKKHNRLKGKTTHIFNMQGVQSSW